MSLDQTCSRFLGWLSREITFAGRGDGVQLLDVDPAGRFWLGRLQSVQEAMESGYGERGERLEPCAMGIKIRPSASGPWQLTVKASVRAWLHNKQDRKWKKSTAAAAAASIQVEVARGLQIFAIAELNEELARVTGGTSLSAELQVEVEFDSQGVAELTILLVNTSPKSEGRGASQGSEFYECHMEVGDIECIPFLLDDLEDSFRYDRRIKAYGVNCGVVQGDNGFFVTEDVPTVDRPRPRYQNTDFPVPDLRFGELEADPIPLIETLATALESWGEANWSQHILDRRMADENWSEGMRLKAGEAALEFEVECRRVRDGIALLRSDKLLAKAFRGMNRAMIIASAGAFETWRPFQLGFLLANLASIVRPVDESEIVDIVWFATGGGKTETYLGLLITAALYDRLTGKISGISAWSRFPLRMLSLQQTQRFANALAGAELVRRELKLGGDVFSLGFFVGEGATPNRIPKIPKPGTDEPDRSDDRMPLRYQVLEYCPFCRANGLEMAFNSRAWTLEHRCTNPDCSWPEKSLPVYVVDEEIYRFLPTVIVGTLDKAASIALQASMRGMVGAPGGACSKQGHGYVYAPRSTRPNGCLVPDCTGTSEPLPMDPSRYGPSFRLQDELHLLRDSLGAVDSHYEAIYDALQMELCGQKPKILASSATLTGYKKQVDVLYRRAARVFPVPSPAPGGGFWTSDSPELMRRFVAVAPRGVTIEHTVDRILEALQRSIRRLISEPEAVCLEAGIEMADVPSLISIYGTDVIYGNTLRDLEAVVRSTEGQIEVPGRVNTASLTGKTMFSEVRKILERLQGPEEDFYDRLHIVSASSMMSHGVDVDRLNVMVMLGLPLSAAEFIQATARAGRKYPALIFVIHKIGRERDAGIYRAFKEFVEQGDRFVEPVPITRRSRRVLERTIAGLEHARMLMIHEPKSGMALTTPNRVREYLRKGGVTMESELEAIIAALGLEGELDEPMKRDLRDWFRSWKRNLDTPPPNTQFTQDLYPSGTMRSLRDVEKTVPITGSRLR